MDLIPRFRELLKGNVPTLVLSVLAAGPLHGYGIAREIGRLSESAIQLKEGTLYPVLHAMESEGLLDSDWVGEAEGRRSRVYRLTTEGLAELERRKAQWTMFSSAMDRVIEGGRGA